jgi:hypothetical protein
MCPRESEKWVVGKCGVWGGEREGEREGGGKVSDRDLDIDVLYLHLSVNKSTLHLWGKMQMRGKRRAP